MQTYGIIVGGKPIPNVTVQTFPSEDDVRHGIQSHAARINSGNKSAIGKAIEAAAFANMRQRYAKQGAEEVKYFPVA